MAVSLAAAEEEKRPARVAPEQVLLTLPSDNEAVEFCTALGEVQAKAGMGYGAGATCDAHCCTAVHATHRK
jgi:hypothetical protein